MPRRRPLALVLTALAAAGCAAIGCAADTPPVAPTTPTIPTTPTTPSTPTTPTTPAAPPLALSILDAVPRTDPVTRVGVDFVAGVQGAVYWSAVVLVDSGTAAERRLQLLDASSGYASDKVYGVGFAPGPGRHRFTVVVTDTARRTASASFERTFLFDDAPYTVRALPDLGYGADATGVTERGIVTGWVRAADGRRKPALWQDGTLRVIPAPDTIDVVATGANAAGDVLLQYDSARAGPRAARVRRADGAELLVGNGVSCCVNAVTLTETRLALATTLTGSILPYSEMLDVASGTRTDVAATGTLVLNDAGLRAGATQSGTGPPGIDLRTVGFNAPPPPTSYAVTICDRARRFSRLVPLAIDDRANVLTDYCGNLVVLMPQNSTQAGGGEFVDRHLGRTTAVRMSRQGGLLAALDTTSAQLLLWRLASERTARVAVGANAWRVDRIAGVNGAGLIAAHGVGAAGREAALLFTPAATP